MKIAIVTAHFMPEIGYQEVYLARAFSRLGNHVRVFTSDRVSPQKKKIINKKYNHGITKDFHFNYEILRLKPFFTLGAVVLVRHMKKYLDEFSPELIIVVGIGKIFPYTTYYSKYKIISLFGDNSDFFKWNSLKQILTSIRLLISKNLIKKWFYRLAIKKSHKVILYTPQTERIIKKYISKKTYSNFENKKEFVPLGYDSSEFYFDESGRREAREKLKINDRDIVFITATRINENKGIEKIIDAFLELLNENFNIKYILIGFLSDSYEKKLKNYIRLKGLENHIYCLSFLDHEYLRKYFSAADYGIWLQPAISIQEAMGTGLTVLLEDKESLNHLINNENGLLLNTQNIILGLREAIKKINQDIGRRKFVADYNSNKLSYDSLIKNNFYAI